MTEFRVGSGRIIPVLAFLLLPAFSGAQSQATACTHAALDHVPIAVGSLRRAELAYEQLGFRLKPGRTHANGLRNAFAKFTDGSYLELISPERGATDGQTARYVELLADGDGGAAVALRIDSLEALDRRLSAAGIVVNTRRYGSAFATLGFADADLRWVFLIEYLNPVVDPPELLAHPNTAVGIETVWLAEPAFSTLSLVSRTLCVPAMQRAAAAERSAPVAGVTLRVRSLMAARQALGSAGMDLPVRTDERGRSIVVPADSAHGVFLEFLEPTPP